ncbi:hypothetical protein KEJ25_10150 [Candidatus Bathyarchaeota archaeon]|nr:hypothetical protein [Candidatus Brockarchaeota archaeon]MBS7618930.1 hypothetical protein [Candidatus Bathyarchaeota archaeon]
MPKKWSMKQYGGKYHLSRGWSSSTIMKEYNERVLSTTATQDFGASVQTHVVTPRMKNSSKGKLDEIPVYDMILGKDNSLAIMGDLHIGVPQSLWLPCLRKQMHRSTSHSA